jgi:hypothetical protein
MATWRVFEVPGDLVERQLLVDGVHLAAQVDAAIIFR